MRKVFQPPPFEWLLLTDRSVVSVVGVSSFPIWLPWLGPIHNTSHTHQISITQNYLNELGSRVNFADAMEGAHIQITDNR